MISEVTNRKILIVEDNSKLLSSIAAYFKDKQNEVFCSANLADAKEIYAKEELDAVVLDVILPDGSGLDLLKIKKDPHPPVVILSDLGDDDNVLMGFGAGAADYVTKPCSMKILEMRLSVRLLPKKDAHIELGGLSVDANERTVKYLGKDVSLTSSEFNLLFFMIKNAGTYFIASELYEKVWGAPSLQTTTVKRHLSTLRRKLKEVAPDKNLILTDFGKGYCFPHSEVSP